MKKLLLTFLTLISTLQLFAEINGTYLYCNRRGITQIWVYENGHHYYQGSLGGCAGGPWVIDLRIAYGNSGGNGNGNAYGTAAISLPELPSELYNEEFTPATPYEKLVTCMEEEMAKEILAGNIKKYYVNAEKAGDGLAEALGLPTKYIYNMTFTEVNSEPTKLGVNVKSDKDRTAKLRIRDFNNNIISENTVSLTKGDNTLVGTKPSNLSGQGVVELEVTEKTLRKLYIF